jgi:hypothetical protein
LDLYLRHTVELSTDFTLAVRITQMNVTQVLGIQDLAKQEVEENTRDVFLQNFYA